jgi:hypothetical protein
MAEEKVFTVVRLAPGATLQRACELAGIKPKDVHLTQTMNEKVAPDKLTGDFCVISFDGDQITISERIKGERRLRGFAVGAQSSDSDAH